jgi:general secretion pathway protein K
MMARVSQQSGIALLAALALTMALVIIMGNIFYRHQINVAQTALSLHQDQAYLLALGGESWAQQMLAEDRDDNQHDGFDDLWAQAIPALPVDGGLLNGCISDLQAKFNLNNFSKFSTSGDLAKALGGNEASFPKIWNYLLNLQEIPQFPGRIAAIIDWVDPGSATINSYGAERDEYASLMPPRMVADLSMAEPSELASVMGYEIFEVQKLMPWITALPIKSGSPTTININTASDELLLALGGTSYDLQFRDSVVAGRPFEKMQEFYDQLALDLGLSETDLKVRWPETLVDIKSEYFQLYIEVILGEARIEVNSVIYRPQPTGDLAIISRDLTAVPTSVEKNNSSELLDKLVSSIGAGSDKEIEDVEDMIDDQQVQPACLMIGA